jgi:catechol 2,3-dioxygenase-like lactoylglutathione lyase family enzyme
VTVRDLDRTLAFDCGVLGAELRWRDAEPQEGAQTDAIFGREGARVHVRRRPPGGGRRLGG